MIAGEPCLDFINSVRFRGRTEECETIIGYEDLLDWTSEAHTLSVAMVPLLRKSAQANPAGATKSLQRAWQLRDVLFSAFSAVVRDERVPEGDIDALNKWLRKAGGHRIISKLTDQGYEWSWDVSGNLDAPLWPIAHSAGNILTSGQKLLVKQCDGEACLRIFLDSTRNRRRRWCDAAGCGNRHRVREHYRRSLGQVRAATTSREA